MSRAGWDETWMRVAEVMGRRSPCTRAQVGAVVVDPDNRVIATGYNGMPAGLLLTTPARERYRPTCLGDCPRAQPGAALEPGYADCLAIHAEANALLFCDRRDREGGTVYVSTAPCFTCAKLVANSGLSRVVARFERDLTHRQTDRVREFLLDVGLEVHTWEDRT